MPPSRRPIICKGIGRPTAPSPEASLRRLKYTEPAAHRQGRIVRCMASASSTGASARGCRHPRGVHGMLPSRRRIICQGIGAGCRACDSHRTSGCYGQREGEPKHCESSVAGLGTTKELAQAEECELIFCTPSQPARENKQAGPLKQRLAPRPPETMLV